MDTHACKYANTAIINEHIHHDTVHSLAEARIRPESVCDNLRGWHNGYDAQLLLTGLRVQCCHGGVYAVRCV